MESWTSLGGKEGHINIQISAKPGLNWGPCGRKTEILPTAPTTPAHLRFDHKTRMYDKKFDNKKKMFNRNFDRCFIDRNSKQIRNNETIKS